MVSKRLQLQERITNDVLYVVKGITKSNDIAVRIRGSHSCVSARGVKKKSKTETFSSIGSLTKEVFL